MTDNEYINKQDQEIQSDYNQLQDFNNDNNDNLNKENFSEENNKNKEENLDNEKINNNENNKTNDNKINEMNEQRNIIQSQLKFICNKIENAVNIFHTKKLEKEREEIEKLTFNHIDTKPITKDINSYKEKIKIIQEQLDNIYNISMINQIENDIKGKKDFIKEMKRDNNILKKATKEQEKDINDYNKKNKESDEINFLQKKIKKLKEGLKITKDFHKEQENKLKEQQSQIDALNKKTKLIKDNIEHKKKQLKNKNQEKDKNNNNKNNNTNKFNTQKLEIIDETDDPTILDEQKIKLENEIESEEKNYKNEINNQKIMISEMQKDIDIINLRLKSIVQCRRIEELKKKEIEKIKKKELQNKKLQIYMNNNIIENMKQRGYSRDHTNKRIINNLNNINNNYNLYQWTDKNDNSPNFKMGKKIAKPFEINKFTYGKYKSQRPNTDLSNLINGKRSNKKTTLGQIEQLKNDIQNTLKDNEFLNEKIINNYNNNNYKINEPSAIIDNTLNNDISDIKNDIEYLNKNLDKASIKQTGDKRKPFEKINFK